MQHRPEYQLSSQSPVLTARFHPFDTHVIIGGTYSGQVHTETAPTEHPNRLQIFKSRFKTSSSTVDFVGLVDVSKRECCSRGLALFFDVSVVCFNLEKLSVQRWARLFQQMNLVDRIALFATCCVPCRAYHSIYRAVGVGVLVNVFFSGRLR